MSGSHTLSPHGAGLETHSHRARPCGFCHLGWAEGLSDGWKLFCLKRDHSKPSKLNTSCTRTFRVVSTRVPVIVSLVTASSWMTWATGDERTHTCAHRQGPPPHVIPASCLVAQRGCSSCSRPCTRRGWAPVRLPGQGGVLWTHLIAGRLQSSPEVSSRPGPARPCVSLLGGGAVQPLRQALGPDERPSRGQACNPKAPKRV